MNPYLPAQSVHSPRLDPEFAIIPQRQMGWLGAIALALGGSGFLMSVVATSMKTDVGMIQVGGAVPLLAVLFLIGFWLSQRRKQEELRLIAMAFHEPVVRIGEVQREVLGGGRNGVLLLTRSHLVFLDPVTTRVGAGEESLPLPQVASMVRHLGWKIGNGRLILPRAGQERMILRLGNPDAWAIAIRLYDPSTEVIRGRH